jgi:hypothetical protein
MSAPEAAKKSLRAALEAPRRADAEQLPHQQAEIQAAGMNHQTFEDVVVTAEVDASHAARFVQVRRRPFQLSRGKCRRVRDTVE